MPRGRRDSLAHSASSPSRVSSSLPRFAVRSSPAASASSPASSHAPFKTRAAHPRSDYSSVALAASQRCIICKATEKTEDGLCLFCSAKTGKSSNKTNGRERERKLASDSAKVVTPVKPPAAAAVSAKSRGRAELSVEEVEARLKARGELDFTEGKTKQKQKSKPNKMNRSQLSDDDTVAGHAAPLARLRDRTIEPLNPPQLLPDDWASSDSEADPDYIGPGGRKGRPAKFSSTSAFTARSAAPVADDEPIPLWQLYAIDFWSEDPRDVRHFESRQTGVFVVNDQPVVDPHGFTRVEKFIAKQDREERERKIAEQKQAETEQKASKKRKATAQTEAPAAAPSPPLLHCSGLTSLFPGESPASISSRLSALDSVWSDLKSMITEIVNTAQSNTFGQIELFVDVAVTEAAATAHLLKAIQAEPDAAADAESFLGDFFLHFPVSIGLPVGLVLAGVNVADHGLIFQQLAKFLNPKYKSSLVTGPAAPALASSSIAYSRSRPRPLAVTLTAQQFPKLSIALFSLVSALVDHFPLPTASTGLRSRSDHVESIARDIQNRDRKIARQPIDSLITWYSDYCKGEFGLDFDSMLENPTDKFPKLVIILEDLESFDGIILTEFLSLLLHHPRLRYLPFVVLLGVSTTPDIVHSLIPSSVSTHFSLSQFRLDGSISLMSRITDRLLFQHQLPIHLSPETLRFLVQFLSTDNYSVSSFMRILHFMLAQHYDAAPLSQLSKLAWDDPATDWDALLAQCSEPELHQLRSFPSMRSLSSADFSLSYCSSSLSSLLIYRRDFPVHCSILSQLYQRSASSGQDRERVKLINDKEFFMEFAGKSESRDKIRSAIEKWIAIAPPAAITAWIEKAIDFYQQHSEKRAREDEKNSKLNTNKKKKGEEAQSNGAGKARLAFEKEIQELKKICEAAESSANTSTVSAAPATVNRRPQNAADRRAALISVATHSAASASPVREAFKRWLSRFLSSQLRPFDDLPLHEIFWFDCAPQLRYFFQSQPRAALVTALLASSYYSAAQLDLVSYSHKLHRFCASAILDTESREEFPFSQDQPSNQLPDICLAFQLYEQAGRYINVADWFIAFVAFFQIGGKPKNAAAAAQQKSKARNNKKVRMEEAQRGEESSEEDLDEGWEVDSEGEAEAEQPAANQAPPQEQPKKRRGRKRGAISLSAPPRLGDEEAILQQREIDTNPFLGCQYSVPLSELLERFNYCVATLKFLGFLKQHTSKQDIVIKLFFHF